MKKGLRRGLLIGLALCLACLPALAMADSTLRVQGNASVRVAPDMAVLTVGYATESAETAAAQRETADVTAAIVEAARALGVAEDDIKTSYISTYPVYSYADEGQTLRGYRVEHMLSITVKDFDTVGDVLDAALAAGANQAGSITYRSTGEKEAYLKALGLAVEDASEKADALSIASGMWLGRLEEVNELSSYASPIAYASEARYDSAAGGSLGGSVIAGDLEITASVELVYEIR